MAGALVSAVRLVESLGREGRPSAGDNKRFREEMERLTYEHKALKDANYFTGLRIRQDEPPPEDDLVGGL